MTSMTPRVMPRIHVHKNRILVLIFIILCSLLTYYTFFTGDDPDDLQDAFSIPAESFARSDVQDALQYLTKYSWPVFQGYNSKYASAKDNPPDESLFERLKLSQENLKSRTFTLKGQPRHKWKFEKIIHQTWKSDNIPARTAQWVRKWKEINPDWTFIFWTDKSQKEFIRQHYPRLYEVYNSWTFAVQRADMFRYIALYAFGGVYADLDVEDLKPLEQLRDWGSCILSREPDPQVHVLYPPLASWANNWTFTCNAVMACQSHHPFLHYLISRTVQNSPLMRNSECPLEKTILCTGPWMLSFAYTFYRRSIGVEKRHKLPEYDVISPEDYKYFLPTYDPSRRQKLKNKCLWMRFLGSSRQRSICYDQIASNYANKPASHSITNHHWFSSYHNKFSSFVNVTDVTDVVRWGKATEEKLFDMCETNRCRDEKQV